MTPAADAGLSPVEREKKLAGEHAVTFVTEGMRVGLGTGSTAVYAVRALGARVRAGLKVSGVPTSEATRLLAAAEGIPLLTLDDVANLDLAIDGADEADANLQLTKGGGGALLREKVVATLAKRFIVICDSKKLVAQLGAFPLPVEVVPFATAVVARQLRAMRAAPSLRKKPDGTTYLTDNGNVILDCRFGTIADPRALAKQLDTMVGVAEHGLFVDMTSMIIVGRGETTQVIEPKT